MPLSADDVYRVVHQYGPIIPNQIKQRLGASDTTLINVYLSELRSEGKIRMTDVKLGSSKFYYTPQQTPKLASLIEHLNEKDRRTATRLKEEGVMRASTADPLTRVGLQNIPDFAKPITVKTGQGEETFYRWYAMTSDDAQRRIREMMGTTKQEPQSAPEPETVPVKDETPKEEPAEEEPEKESAPEEEPEETKSEEPKAEKQTLLEKHEPQSDFARTVLNYFSDKDMAVKDFDEVRKGSEIDAIIQMPTPVGSITYFCKAKSKKTSNDGDLAAAILAAKAKILPAMYLTTGQVTNKAKENPELGEVTVVEIGSSD